MKIGLTEKQYKSLLKNVGGDYEISEQGETTSTSSGGEGYPEVGKWESGVTRGPANQIAVTKWSDIVGSTLQRGKGNQLK